MNIHAPPNALTKFPSWDFRGVPFMRNGKKWIRAKSRLFYYTWYYCFDDDEIHCSIPAAETEKDLTNENDKNLTD